ncbi:unnamed protein product [Paramecium octaurelia]|uniref:Uncharacterized protein n=1 Tax=Paramecium octaurelia TaxID=43137 RepID=A0A8S1SSY6_PAROT|nr:unnamed protein product [Paramecium octaurelia]
MTSFWIHIHFNHSTLLYYFKFNLIQGQIIQKSISKPEESFFEQFQFFKLLSDQLTYQWSFQQNSFINLPEKWYFRYFRIIL